MKQLLTLLVLLSFLFADANDIKYPVSAIPSSLIRTANVVKRMEEIKLRIINTHEVILLHKYALTVLNGNGDDKVALIEFYDKLQKITSIKGALYDAAGNQLKKLKAKDVMDVSAVDDKNLMDDNRKKVHRFYYKRYPYTVEYEVEIKFNNTLFFPAWLPMEDENFAVEQSAYSIICPVNYHLRYRSFNYDGEPVITTEKDKKVMRWEVKDLPGIVRPYASPSLHELTTMVFFAPGEFEIEGYKGNMSSWQEFGKFVYSLKKDRDQLPEEIIQKVKHLINGVADEREKIKILYEYMQHQTRYISIQLGLGGWQPLDASFVAQKGYGDCKALVNYMYSLLKTANIKSYYTLVKAGSGENIIEDFPSEQFNHVILCVPLQKDTIWLECTSQTLPAGYLGDFTANRKVLLIDEIGGTLVLTPRYTINENKQVRNISGKIDEEGTLNIKVNTDYGGIRQDELSEMIHYLSQEKVQKVLQEELELSTYNINNFSYAEMKSVLPELNEQLDITVSGCAILSGKRLFVTPNILNKSIIRFYVDDHRKVDLVFHQEWRDEDVCEIEIPEGYRPEFLPENISLKTKFGTYSCSVKLNGNKIIYHRMQEQFSGRFPATDQIELAKFYDEIYKADRNKLVLVKKAG